MREQPWHLRHATVKHEQWFHNLVELHELTNDWLQALQGDKKPTYQITRGLTKAVVQNLWMLDSLSGTELEPLLDEEGAELTLARLDHTVWAVQAWTLASLLEKTENAEKSALVSSLEQSCFKMGRKCAESRWPQPQVDRVQFDLRAIIESLRDCPLSGLPFGDGFLVKRAICSNVQLELRACPHHSTYPEVEKIADELCSLHVHWMRGYCYALNNRVTVESKTAKPRCTLDWRFIS